MFFVLCLLAHWLYRTLRPFCRARANRSELEATKYTSGSQEALALTKLEAERLTTMNASCESHGYQFAVLDLLRIEWKWVLLSNGFKRSILELIRKINAISLVFHLQRWRTCDVGHMKRTSKWPATMNNLFSSRAHWSFSNFFAIFDGG